MTAVGGGGDTQPQTDVGSRKPLEERVADLLLRLEMLETRYLQHAHGRLGGRPIGEVRTYEEYLAAVRVAVDGSTPK